MLKNLGILFIVKLFIIAKTLEPSKRPAVEKKYVVSKILCKQCNYNSIASVYGMIILNADFLKNRM